MVRKNDLTLQPLFGTSPMGRLKQEHIETITIDIKSSTREQTNCTRSILDPISVNRHSQAANTAKSCEGNNTTTILAGFFYRKKRKQDINSGEFDPGSG